MPVFLACVYGLRRSELLGLRWSSIDFQKGTISINTTVVKEKAGDGIQTVIRENTTKTDYSMRVLPLCPYTYQYLAAVQCAQQQSRLLCGGSYSTRHLDFVCVDAMGTLLQPDYVSQRFQRVLELYGLRHIRFHDLRHSCATIMLYLGYTMKDIQTWLGHSNYYFTADTYVHSASSAHFEMAHSFSQRLGELLPPNFNSQTNPLEMC